MKEKIRKVIFIVSILLILAGVGYLVFHFTQSRKNKDIYNNAQGKFNSEEIKKKREEKPQEEEQNEELRKKFSELQRDINQDIYAWITIPDTNIDYPIVQEPNDNTYYLEHTIEGNKGYPGAIYTENFNAKDFSDFNTVIYGHDMKDGSMFKHVHKFANADFFNSHDTITIYTEKEIKTYKVFAAVVYDNRHILYTYGGDTKEDRLAFIQSLYDSSNLKNLYREGIEVDENSHLITLSTCITGQPSKRYIVVAAEVE